MKTDNITILFFQKSFGLFTLLFFLFLLTGCIKSQNKNMEIQPIESTEQETLSNQYIDIPVISYGRYQLVEVGPIPEQQNLLTQIVDVTIPIIDKQTTVLDAMKYVLLNSGYHFCKNDSINIFNTFDLPLAHRKLGPVTIEDALNVLAGAKFQMYVDDYTRQICFNNVDKQIKQVEEINNRELSL